MFALLMALSNFGVFFSKYLGTALVLGFGVSNSNYDNFAWVILAKSILMLTPVLFVPFLIPDGCPQDDEDDDDGVDDDTTYGSFQNSILGRRSKKSLHGELDGSTSMHWSEKDIEDVLVDMS